MLKIPKLKKKESTGECVKNGDMTLLMDFSGTTKFLSIMNNCEHSSLYLCGDICMYFGWA